MTTSPSLEDVLEDVLPDIADRAGAIDRSDADPIDDLRVLAHRLDLFDPSATSVATAVRVIESVARASLTVGFVAWAQRMAAEYLALAPASPRTATRLADVVAVRRRGVTAMAAGQRQAVGLEKAPVTATPDGAGGYRLSGTVAWASNVAADSVVVLAANLPGGGTRVLAVDAADLTVRAAPDLLGLNATASGSLLIDDVAVPADAVVSTDLQAFAATVRPRFLLLQTAFCSGVTGAALDAAIPQLAGTGAVYAGDHEDLAARYDDLRDRLHGYAADSTPGTVAVRDLIALRLESTTLATASTRLGLALDGGRGYATASATNRRFREASFLPVQSPSEAQLRWELARAEAVAR
ncbi:acyl-CoA dehydrogenase family protein [Georgenia muralis]|uniref:Alkylation response protein AidB-like acyl-CoA dehydrogenase n=1 Tax=Georgenia muralis TaxID=154117 RepID=A0A3N4ZUG8_9MICO|nr:acyl-CoA dehydrogenase family protein [Georgenia muralis]RPF29078.1 alkylation response protein AidB-like acyl-CoA dehydrogenase [Georgenia muralis]